MFITNWLFTHHLHHRQHLTMAMAEGILSIDCQIYDDCFESDEKKKVVKTFEAEMFRLCINVMKE